MATNLRSISSVYSSQFSTVPTLASGDIPDTSTFLATAPNLPQYARSGVPTMMTVPVLWSAPAAADDDYYFNNLVATATGSFTPTGTATLAVNAATGVPFCRDVIVTPNQSTSGTLTITYIDIQGRQVTSGNIAFAASSTAVRTSWTCQRIVSLNITVAFDASTTLDVGFDDRFGLPYPMWADTVQHVFRDSGGNDYPSTALVVTTDYTIEAGLVDVSTRDAFGTVSLVSSSTDPDGTGNYLVIYICTYNFQYASASAAAPAYPLAGTTWPDPLFV